MNTRSDIEAFVAGKNLAFVGISSDKESFSAMAYDDLKKKGYRLYGVNPNMKTLNGDTVYPSIAAIPDKVDGAIFFTRPAVTEKVLPEALARGIKNVWIQQGAENHNVVSYCREKGLNAVTKQCILMFTEPVSSLHKFHRAVKRLFGRIPK